MKISWGRPSDRQSSGFFTKTLMNIDVYTQTHEHALSSRSSSCRKHLERSDAHMSMSLFAAFAFLQRIYISRKTYSFIVLQMQSADPT